MSLQIINVSLAESITASNNKTHIYDKNGITVIDIATPNKEGISHNKYNKFNVSNNGVVLNNLITDGYSLLSGRLNSNQNLDKNHASIIINEVTGESVSELTGILEVVGKSAAIISVLRHCRSSIQLLTRYFQISVLMKILKIHS